MFSALVWAFCLAGGLVYAILQLAGLDSLEAGVWSQLLLVGGLIGCFNVYFPGSESEDDLSSAARL